MRPIFISVMILFLLAACGIAAPASAPTAAETAIPPTPSATATVTLSPVPTTTPEPEAPAAAETIKVIEPEIFLQGFNQLTTYENMMKVSAADLLEAAGGAEGTFQDVAKMLNKHANENTTWGPGTPYATLLEARHFSKGSESLTLDFNVPMKLASELPLQYRVMHVSGNVIPGLSEDMTLITVTWPLAGGGRICRQQS